jgi:hypothetical protein
VIPIPSIFFFFSYNHNHNPNPTTTKNKLYYQEEYEVWLKLRLRLFWRIYEEPLTIAHANLANQEPLLLNQVSFAGNIQIYIT